VIGGGNIVSDPAPTVVESSQSQQIQRSVQALLVPGPTTIFFQFAGEITRERAQAILKGLAKEGYDAPGEERVAAAAGLHEIRYFFEEDRDRAVQAAGDVNNVLAALGYRAEVTIKSFADFASAKPRPGVLELWLEPLRTS
jgi:hypothetical protein